MEKNNNKILIVCATSMEKKVIQTIFQTNFEKKELKKFEFLICWVWNYTTILNLTKIFCTKNIEKVINIWICGYKNEYKPIIQIWVTTNFQTQNELVVPIFKKLAPIEEIISTEKQLQNFDFSQNYIDMESWGIEYVCNNFNIERYILKIPLDNVLENQLDQKKCTPDMIQIAFEKVDWKNILEKII